MTSYPKDPPVSADEEVEAALMGPWFHLVEDMSVNPGDEVSKAKCGIFFDTTLRFTSWPYCPKCFAVKFPGREYHP